MRNTPEPLQFYKGTNPYRIITGTIPAVWQKMEQKYARDRLKEQYVKALRSAFCAGLYTAAAVMVAEDLGAREISEAAGRIERGVS